MKTRMTTTTTRRMKTTTQRRKATRRTMRTIIIPVQVLMCQPIKWEKSVTSVFFGVFRDKFTITSINSLKFF